MTAETYARLMPDPFYVGSPLATTVMAVQPRRDGEWRFTRTLADGERRLGHFILPPFQRPPVWSREQQIRLVESVWLELPIGVYIYNQAPRFRGPTDGWLIDGQQRITAMMAYFADEFPVFGYLWSEVTETDQRAFAFKHFPCVELRMTGEAELRDIYDRLAYGGTPHEPLTT